MTECTNFLYENGVFHVGTFLGASLVSIYLTNSKCNSHLPFANI